MRRKDIPVAFDLDQLPAEVLAFLAERQLASLSTQRLDGSLHVVPVGFGYEATSRTARIITSVGARKVRNIGEAGGRAVLCQVDGGRWLTLEGWARIVSDADGVAQAVEAYAIRYGAPAEHAERVALEIVVERMMGRG